MEGKEKIIRVAQGTYAESFTLSGVTGVIIEGGVDSFTLQIPAFEDLDIISSSGVTLTNFTIDASLINTNLLNISSATEVNLKKMTISATNQLISASNSTLSIENSNLTTSNTSLVSIDINGGSSTIVKNNTFQGGSYFLSIKAATGISLDGNQFSGMSSGAMLIDDSDNPQIFNTTVTGVPHSNSDVAGIFIQNGQGGRIENTTISGVGASTPPCTATELESGITVDDHNTLIIENPSVSSMGCAGIKVNKGKNVTIARFTLNSSGRGVYFVDAEANLFQGTISTSVEAGAYLDDSLSAIDFTTMSSTTNGPGMTVVNTTTGDSTGYFVSNSSRFDNNSAQGILISGNGTSPGFKVTVTVTTFENNTGYAIEADTPSNSADFICNSNTFTTQPQTIHPNLNPGSGSCNP